MIDQRRAQRIATLDAHGPFRFLTRQIGPETADLFLFVDRKRMCLPFRLAVGVGGAAHIGGEQPTGLPPEFLAPEAHSEARMVEQVLPDGQIGHDRNARRAQPVGRADARTLQNRRAVVDACAQHDIIRLDRYRLALRVEIDETGRLRA